MVAELLLMLNFLTGVTGTNPYWANSERMYFSFSSVSASGTCFYDDGVYEEADRDYFIQSTFVYNFTLLSNSETTYVLQLNSIETRHDLYVNFEFDGQILADTYSYDVNNLEINYSSADIGLLSQMYAETKVEMEYSELIVYLYKNSTSLISYGTTYFDDHWSLVYNNFNCKYVFDTRMVRTQVEEHLALMYNDDFSNGYNLGYSNGFDQGYGQGNANGYQVGYSTGYEEGSSEDAVATSIFIGIVNVALLPINMFLSMLNFKVFGINIGGFVSALLTIAIVVIIMRIVISGGNKSDS